MDFKLKTFDQLTTSELYDLMQLRAEVFVVEQTCAYQDLDGKDKQALHLCGYVNGELVCYSRLLAPGISYKECAIGRVVVSPKHRRRSFGIELMKRAKEECLKKFKTDVIIVSAQKYLEKFYTDLGFVTEGKDYLEDDIPHVKMRFIQN